MAEAVTATAATDTPKVRVAICICTYRRPEGLQALLSALCDQVFTDIAAPQATIVVADNECSDRNRDVCQRVAQRCHYPLVYLREAQRGISHARNACLDNLPAGTDFVAMIDDDEIPDPGWLNHLLVAQGSTSADIVAGPTLPAFEAGTPAWIRDTGYFAKPQHPESYRDLEEFPPTATCNVLLRADIFATRGVRFDPALALSGSEDKLLFQDLKQRGLKFVWAARAKAVETIPAARANLRYLLSESLRRGSTKFYVKTTLKASGPAGVLKLTLRSALRALSAIIGHSARACVYLLAGKRQRDRLALSLLAVAENIGFLGGIFGYRKSHY
jgi:succinoglycan biosynthesis protein ExoM